MLKKQVLNYCSITVTFISTENLERERERERESTNYKANKQANNKPLFIECLVHQHLLAVGAESDFGLNAKQTKALFEEQHSLGPSKWSRRKGVF